MFLVKNKKKHSLYRIQICYLLFLWILKSFFTKISFCKVSGITYNKGVVYELLKRLTLLGKDSLTKNAYMHLYPNWSSLISVVASHERKITTKVDSWLKVIGRLKLPRLAVLKIFGDTFCIPNYFSKNSTTKIKAHKKHTLKRFPKILKTFFFRYTLLANFFKYFAKYPLKNGKTILFTIFNMLDVFDSRTVLIWRRIKVLTPSESLDHHKVEARNKFFSFQMLSTFKHHRLRFCWKQSKLWLPSI